MSDTAYERLLAAARAVLTWENFAFEYATAEDIKEHGADFEELRQALKEVESHG